MNWNRCCVKKGDAFGISLIAFPPDQLEMETTEAARISPSDNSENRIYTQTNGAHRARTAPATLFPRKLRNYPVCAKFYDVLCHVKLARQLFYGPRRYRRASAPLFRSHKAGGSVSGVFKTALPEAWPYVTQHELCPPELVGKQRLRLTGDYPTGRAFRGADNEGRGGAPRLPLCHSHQVAGGTLGTLVRRNVMNIDLSPAERHNERSLPFGRYPIILPSLTCVCVCVSLFHLWLPACMHWAVKCY